jgi:hypothetical protein
MGKLDFTRYECIKSLMMLGFMEKKSRKHDKYIPPDNLNINTGLVPFIMIPRHNKFRCQMAILQELRKMGGKKLEDKFLENI